MVHVMLAVLLTFARPQVLAVESTSRRHFGGRRGCDMRCWATGRCLSTSIAVQKVTLTLACLVSIWLGRLGCAMGPWRAQAPRIYTTIDNVEPKAGVSSHAAMLATRRRTIICSVTVLWPQ